MGLFKFLFGRNKKRLKYFQSADLRPVRILMPASYIESFLIRQPLRNSIVQRHKIENKKKAFSKTILAATAVGNNSGIITRIRNTQQGTTLIYNHGLHKEIHFFEAAVIQSSMANSNNNRATLKNPLVELFGDVGQGILDAGISTREGLEFLANYMKLVDDQDNLDQLKDPALLAKLKGINGPAIVLGDEIRAKFKIPDNFKPGASPSELLEEVTKAFQLEGSNYSPNIFKDLESKTNEELLEQYLNPNSNANTNRNSGNNSDGSSNSNASATVDTSETPDRNDVNITESQDGTESPTATITSETPTESNNSSSNNSSLFPNVVVEQVTLEEAVNPSGDPNDPKHGDSFVRVEVDPGSTGSNSSSNGTDDYSNDNDDSSSSSDESDDNNNSDSPPPNSGDDTQGYRPDPEGGSSSSIPWSQMTSLQQQAILIVAQAKYNSLINPGGDESGTDTAATRRPRRMPGGFRIKLDPYIYPANGDNDDSIPRPNNPGTPQFGPGQIIGSLPDPHPDPIFNT